MSKTVSAIMPNKTRDELREKCNQSGYNTNEYVAEAIAFAKRNSNL